MKKILQLTKGITLTLAAVMIFLSTNVLTAHAGTVMFPYVMEKTEDGRIKVIGGSYLITDSTGRVWNDVGFGYPYCYTKEGTETEFAGQIITYYTNYLDCYLTDYIKTHNESEWPNFVIKGSDGVPFYYSPWGDDNTYLVDGFFYNRYVKYCYDKETGWWFEDKAYKGPWTNMYNNATPIEDLIEETKTAIANKEVINGKPVEPVLPNFDNAFDSDDAPIHYTGYVLYPDGHIEYTDGRVPYFYQHDNHSDLRMEYSDGRVEYYCNVSENDPKYSDNGTLIRTEYPDGCTEYPDGSVVYSSGHIDDGHKGCDINTLGATVTLKTDCIKVRKNNAVQKPLPKSVKVGKKALKRNKTYTVSYEKYENGWNAVDAVTGEGIYRLVITGKGDCYSGVYKKRLYVTADKSIKTMSSAAVKVNKVPYTGGPITSGVIKTVRIGKSTLTEGTDYTVIYKNNTDSGIGQVVLTAMDGSGFMGTKTVNFTITGNKMSKVKVTGLTSKTYIPGEDADMDTQGNIYRTSVEVTQDAVLTFGTSTLTENKDYTVTYANNTKAGKAKIVFTGKGLYNGTLTKTFKINRKALSDDMVKSENIEKKYTGTARKPGVILKDGKATLQNGKDYKLAYKNNIKAGDNTAQIIVTGKGDYTGKIIVKFSIVNNTAANVDEAKSADMSEADDETATEDTDTENADTEETVTEDGQTEEEASDEDTESDEGETEDTDDGTDTDGTTDDTDNGETGDTNTGDETGDTTDTDNGNKDDGDAFTGTVSGNNPPVAEEPEDEPVVDEPTAGEPVIDEPAADDTGDAELEDTAYEIQLNEEPADLETGIKTD